MVLNKLLLVATTLAVARAGVFGGAGVYSHGAPFGYAPRVAAPFGYGGHAVDTDYDPNPQYSYAYDIQDAITGDSKGQQETRHGDVVQGSYSLVDPDGTRRTVEYTADPVNGFNAMVHREPLGVAKFAAPAAYAAPRPYGAPYYGGFAKAYHG